MMDSGPTDIADSIHVKKDEVHFFMEPKSNRAPTTSPGYLLITETATIFSLEALLMLILDRFLTLSHYCWLSNRMGAAEKATGIDKPSFLKNGTLSTR